MVAELLGADSGYVQDAVELRTLVARSMQARAEAIVKDTIAVYAFAGLESVGLDDRTRLADLLFQLITHARYGRARSILGPPRSQNSDK